MLWKLLKQHGAPNVIFNMVYEFLYHTKNQFLEQHTKRQNTICFYINAAKSRKNGFDGSEELDTNDPHWVFFIPSFREEVISSDIIVAYEVALQAVSCPCCGNYEFANTRSLPENILCSCPET
jgi:hypothetical protein